MPLIKSAIKKLMQDKKRTKLNAKYKKNYKEAVKSSRKTATTKSVKSTYASIDKAAKKGIIHKNKAARLKSQTAKLARKK
ncbi:MAG TPA: 30S ribosomal protein S20 [Candidatus Nitrosocosmicus sp.]|nr:30S ribosomal protein S20 [Candidatus Nitrosocosmicus sp.]